MTEYSNNSKMQSNEALELAFKFVEHTGQNIFLTGKAGTGKTTFLKTLKKRSPKRMIVVAPTGVAAINAGGVTIHSFFQLSFGPQIGIEKEQVRQMRFNKNKINIIRSLDLLVIDEISMVRADILDAIDRVLRRFRNAQLPFGGLQVLMIGDLQQLAPVIKNEEWALLKREYDTGYFFSSKVLQNSSYVSIELTQVFRQQDDRFISLLNKVRDNQLDQEAVQGLNQRYIPNFEHSDKDGYITLCTHNLQAERINEAKMWQLPSKKQVFRAELKGKFPEYAYPTEAVLTLKTGAQVMFVKNDPEVEKQFYNGKIGKITRMDDDAVFVQCPNETEEIRVEPLLWENIKYSINEKTAEITEEFEGSFRQIPLKPAWAITIHKSQGLTFERAIIDAGASFAHGQVYVALSRCKTLEGMVLSTPISEQSIINDGTVSSFIQQVEENQPGETEFLSAKLAYQKELISELFRFNLINHQVRSVNKLAEEHQGSFPANLLKLFREMQLLTAAELLEVGNKFQSQIENYLRQNPELDENQKLQERLIKAAQYFSKKLDNIIIRPLNTADLDLDNRTVKKQLMNTINNLLGEAEPKAAVYKACREGFSTKKILNARAKAQIDSRQPSTKKQKAKEWQNLENVPHPELYNLLRSWRYEKAISLSIPIYMVCSQKSLLEMAHYLPVDVKTLQLINGMGPHKIEQYGSDILQIIQHYCNENAIDRGNIPMKTPPPEKLKKPKADTKKHSFELYKNGKTIAEIAAERGLTAGTIESHLAHYVKMGRLDVKQFLDHDKLKIITNYFKNTENKSFGDAKNALGDEISYSDLRMGLSYLESLENN